MEHPVYRVVAVKIVEPYVLEVSFDDGLARTIDLAAMLEGPVFGPLRDMNLFRRMSIDPEVHTLVWPNGADFDPATLHDWPQHADAMRRMARRCALAAR